MAKSYLIAFYREVSDPDALAAYGALAVPAIKGAGGRFLARGGKVEAFEHGLKERTVVVEFDSFDQAIAAYNSEDYRASLEKLGDGAVRDVRIVEGVE